MRISIVLAALLSILSTVATASAAPDPSAVARVSALLTAYSAKNVPGMMKMLDPQAAMYGTAASEFFTTPSGIESLLQSDYRQWTSSAFGAPRNVTVETSGDFQSVFFDAPFTATFADGKERSFTIRFATVWHDVAGRWLLVQSMNAVVS